MSRFVDRQNARFVDLGPCDCPGKPHDKDWMKVRPKLTYGETLELGDAYGTGGTKAGVTFLLTAAIIEWSWVDEAGKPVPIETETFENLEPDVADRLNTLVTKEKKADPKRSGARSPKP